MKKLLRLIKGLNNFSRSVEVAGGIGDLGLGIGEPFDMIEKEDMSDMFRRAMLEKMQLVGKEKSNIHVL